MSTSNAFSQSAPFTNGLRQVIQKHPFFFLLSYSFSWIISLPYVLSIWGVLPGASHALNDEKAEFVNARILKFCRKILRQVREDLRTLLPLAGEIEVVEVAINGLDAVRKTESLRPDVVLMDLEMPVMDGYEATRQIKSLDPACRVVALTIHSYQEARQKATEPGVDIFIVKGTPVETLVKVITKSKE